MRLIDADALIEKIKNERFSGWGNCCIEIDDAPTVEETIRCEDCKYFRELHDGVGVCKRDENSDRYRHDVCGLVNGDWFCADGEG